MQAVRFRDPQSFLRRAESFLLRAEAENNLLLGIADTIARGLDGDPYLAAVTDEDDVVACAIRTPPYKAVITRAVRPAIECLAEDLEERYPELPEVFGPEPYVADFAGLWAARHGVVPTRTTGQRLFEIGAAPTLAAWPSGGLRVADDRDLPLVVGWMRAFIEEAQPGDPTDPDVHAAKRIAARSVFLWDDGHPVSMAGWAGRTARGVRVNFVYTPPDLRGHGYASACVARLTQRLLAEGRAFCCLYADLANPTSNRIYEKMGYRPIGDAGSYALRSRQAGSA